MADPVSETPRTDALRARCDGVTHWDRAVKAWVHDPEIIELFDSHAELERENAALRTVMIAAADEIQKHWDAHCDAEGYGPVNLMRRLEKGIPDEYGYKAGDFERLREQVAKLEKERDAEIRRMDRLCTAIGHLLRDYQKAEVALDAAKEGSR